MAFSDHIGKSDDGRCTAGKFLARLPETEYQAFKELLKEYTVTQLHRIVKKEYPDHKLPGITTFRNHVRGTCPCSEISE